MTDKATFACVAYICALDAYRGKGRAKPLGQAVVAHPAVQVVGQFTPDSCDAYDVYE